MAEATKSKESVKKNAEKKNVAKEKVVEKKKIAAKEKTAEKKVVKEPVAEKKKVVKESAAEKKVVAKAQSAEKKDTKAEKVEKTEKVAKDAAKNGKIVKLDKMPLMIAGVVAVVLVVVMVVLALVMGKPTEKADDKKTDKDDSSQVEDKKEDEELTLDKTLSVGKLSMKYPSKGWKLDDSTIEGADSTASISKGNDSYVLLTTVESDADLTTKEFAEASMSSYKTSGFMTVEALSAVKLNGKEWYKARMYGQGAYATVVFNATGDNYYIATFASTSKTESAEIKQMIETLTVK